ncbi:MAG TPA: hypothetical protein VMU38_00085 [Candidatus Binatia bacterium]|nr:hypothetical protein [Candidatus Binatia bacterium]
MILAASTGCGGSQAALSPAVGQFAPVQRLEQRSGEVQYVSDLSSGTLLEFDYPKSNSPIGSIGFSGGGECTKGARTFWATAAGEIAEFKVGGSTPIRVLKASTSGCTVDPATGDLAASEFFSGVIIFRKARGKGRVVSGLSKTYFVGYDDESDLFVDGFGSTDAFELVELRKGSSAFETITTSNAVGFPGSVQWDGKYLTVLDQLAGQIYQYTVNGTNAMLKRTVVLSGSADCAAAWIARPYAYCVDAGNLDVEVYKYPAGGLPVAVLTGLNAPGGVVSLRAR